jgi:hypothetical protein
MRTSIAVAVLLLGSSAWAGGKAFDEGLSADEAARLTRSLGAMQARYHDAKPAMDRLKKSPEARKTPRLTQAAIDVLKSYTTIGVFLAELESGLKAKNPKAHSFELQLKGELDVFELKLAALKDKALASRAPAVAELIVGTIVIAASLETLYLAFDAAYDAAVADVELALLPTWDVYQSVHFTSPYVVLDDVDPGSVWETAEYEGE